MCRSTSLENSNAATKSISKKHQNCQSKKKKEERKTLKFFNHFEFKRIFLFAPFHRCNIFCRMLFSRRWIIHENKCLRFKMKNLSKTYLHIKGQQCYLRMDFWVFSFSDGDCAITFQCGSHRCYSNRKIWLWKLSSVFPNWILLVIWHWRFVLVWLMSKQNHWISDKINCSTDFGMRFPPFTLSVAWILRIHQRNRSS